MSVSLGYALETVRTLVARLVELQFVNLAVLVCDIPRKVGGVQPFSCDALEEVLWFVHFTETVYLLSQPGEKNDGLAIGDLLVEIRNLFFYLGKYLRGAQVS